jgi:uncharacterized membrane protein
VSSFIEFLKSRRVIVGASVMAVIYALSQKLGVVVDSELINQALTIFGLWATTESFQRSAEDISGFLKSTKFVTFLVAILTAVLKDKLGGWFDAALINQIAMGIQTVLLFLAVRPVTPKPPTPEPAS